MRRIMFAIFLCCATTPFSANTQNADDEARIQAQHALMTQIVDLGLPEGDKKFRPSIIAALEERDAEQAIRKFKAILPKLQSPSVVHSLLKVRTADRHVDLGRNKDAAALYEEAIREYPDLPGPRRAAIYRLAYTDQALVSARVWMEYASIRPTAAKRIDGYTFGALTSNLEATGNLGARNALFLTLDRIGYDPGTSARRNDLIFGIFKNAAQDRARSAEARSALARIERPETLRTILSDKRYRRFWSSIENDPQTWRVRAARYVDALALDAIKARDGSITRMFFYDVQKYAGSDGLLAAYGPVLQSVLDGPANPDGANNYVFWVTSMANSHRLAGDSAAAENLFRDGARFFDGMGSVNKFNVSANYARFLVGEGRYEDALAQINPAIAGLESKGTALTALARMHVVRIEALHRLGRLDEGNDSLASIEAVQDELQFTYAMMLLKIDRFDDARDAVLKGLRSRSYEDALRFLQPPLGQNYLPEEERSQKLIDTLRVDPAIETALQRVGRIVAPEPIAIGEPEFPKIIN